MTTMIDTCGLSCPQPVLLVLESITKDAPDTLNVTGDNDASRENVTRAAQNRGYTVSVEAPPRPDVWSVRLHKG